MLKAGTRAKCAVCDTEVMVIRATSAQVSLACGGIAMVPMDAAKTAGATHADSSASLGALVGKRYVNSADTFEVLCTKTGSAELSIDAEALLVKQSKALPSSD